VVVIDVDPLTYKSLDGVFESWNVIAVAEKLRGQDFQGQGHCGKVKGQSVTKLAISTTPHEYESVYRI